MSEQVIGKIFDTQIGWIAQMMSFLETQFKGNCELILYDLSRTGSSAVLDYRNNRSSKMKCFPERSVESIIEKSKGGDIFNVITSVGSQVIKSSTLFFRDSGGAIHYALCVNLDITCFVKCNELLDSFTCANSTRNHSGESMPHDVAGFLDNLIQEANNYVGKDPSDMNKDERFLFLTYLDAHGAFQISKSSVLVSDLLKISKFTLYSDLDRIRNLRLNKDSSISYPI